MFEQTLYGLDKKGGFKVWHITAYYNPEEPDLGAAITISHGKLGGKMTKKHEIFEEGKQGRDAYEQAVFEAQSRIKVQKDKNYRETQDELNDLPVLAMLAKDFAKDGKEEDIEDGYASFKFDGVRSVAKCHRVTGEVTLESRTGQPYDVPHIIEQLKLIMKPGEMYDGELYLHGPALQEINSAVTRTNPQEKIEEASKKLAKASKSGDQAKIDKAGAEFQDALYIAELRPNLQFHVFDIISLDEQFVDRLVELAIVSDRFIDTPNIFKVEYTYVRDFEALLEVHRRAVEAGYEGVMYRTPNGMYESGKRSRGLWKFKVFLDKEFRINRTEKDKQGYIVFVLENDLKDNEFNCVLGDYTWRLAVADDDFSGEWMTVQFQSRYKKTLKPQFPTGKLIRKGIVVDGEFIPSE